MSNYKVDITGINTSDLKSLSTDENNELFKRLQSGDKSAKDELVYGNLKLVLSILKKFNNGTNNLDDLFQVGVVGLIKAIDNFDLSYNLMLSTYAVPLILGEVKRYLRDNTSLRISRSIKDLAYQIIRYKDEYTLKKGITPTNEEIAKNLGIEEYKIAYALDALKDPVSIYSPIYDDGGDPIYLHDQLADKSTNNKDQDMLISMENAINNIKEKERNILIDRFVIGKTQVEIAESLGISQAQVSRIEKNAINNVRKLVK